MRVPREDIAFWDNPAPAHLFSQRAKNAVPMGFNAKRAFVGFKEKNCRISFNELASSHISVLNAGLLPFGIARGDV